MQLRLIHVMETAVVPALNLLPKHLDTQKARVMLLAIGLQESKFDARKQIGGGPARSFWQIEPGTRASKGGVWGVYLHSASSELLRLLCRDRDCGFDPVTIYNQLEHDDIFSAGVARLLLWTNSKPLPAIGNTMAAWDYYLDTWRPGKPHRETWDSLYKLAFDEIEGGP